MLPLVILPGSLHPEVEQGLMLPLVILPGSLHPEVEQG